MNNPSDLSICAEKIPEYSYINPSATPVNVPARFASYLSAKRCAGYEEWNGTPTPTGCPADKMPDWAYGACARIVDLYAQIPTYNMYNAAPTVIQGRLIKITNDKASIVLAPSGNSARDIDDHWTGISSVRSEPLSDNTKTLHGFFYSEDHFQYEVDGSCDEHNDGPLAMGSIGYARSTEDQGGGFGRIFHKKGNTSNSYGKILSYAWPEDDIVYKQGIYGCGDPTLIEHGDYWYIFYTSYSLRRDPSNQFIKPICYATPGNPVFVDSCDNCSSNDCGHIANALLTIARAEKTDVISSSYSNYSNPWKKYKVAQPIPTWTNSTNWQEDGLGGDYTPIWNASNVSGMFDQASDTSKWRGNPKVSYNDYLDLHIMVVRGGTPQGIYLHVNENESLVEWSDPILLLADDTNSNEMYLYPSLIGSTGYDYLTKSANYLYYSRPPDITDKSQLQLYRKHLQFQ